MIEFDYDFDIEGMRDDIENALDKVFLTGSNKGKANGIIARAINKSVKDIEKLMWETVKKTYAVKISGIRKNFDVKKAGRSRLYAIMRTKSPALPLRNFSIRAGVKLGTRPKKGDPFTLAKVFKINKHEELDGGHQGHGPAFLAKFKSGHEAVVERIKGEYMRGHAMKRNLKKESSVRVGGSPRQLMNGKKTKGREQIVELKSIGIAGMLGNDITLGVSEKKAEAILTANIQKEYEKEVGKL